MSQPASSRKNEPSQALLSLAQWGEDRASETDMGNSLRPASAGHRQSLILAGLAGRERAGRRAPEITPPGRPGPSLADLLRGRSRAPEMDRHIVAEPILRDDAQPKSMRLLRAAARARTEAAREPVEAVAAQPAVEPTRPRRGVARTLAGLLKGRQRQAEPVREQVSSPPAPLRETSPGEPRPGEPRPGEPGRMIVQRQAPVAFAPPPLPEPVQSPRPAVQPTPNAHERGHRPVDPYAAYAPPPVAVQQYPYPPAPPSMPGYHQAMPMPMQAPMPQPASAHFYWPQPAMQMPWVPVQPAPWQGTPPAAQMPPEQPAPAPPAPAPAVQQAGPDPLTAEIDAVREQLRVFGDALRQLHQSRASRRIR